MKHRYQNGAGEGRWLTQTLRSVLLTGGRTACSDNRDVWHLLSAGNNLSGLAPALPTMPLEFDFFFVSCTVVKVQSCQLVVASLLL